MLPQYYAHSHHLSNVLLLHSSAGVCVSFGDHPYFSYISLLVVIGPHVLHFFIKMLIINMQELKNYLTHNDAKIWQI